MTGKKLHILIAEDDLDDVFFIKSAFEKSNFFHRIDVASHGLELFELLDNPEYPRPDVILTDLNMPKMDGYEVLETIQKSEELSKIPVIVLSTSNSEDSIQRCKDLGAKDYLVKPFDLNEFEQLASKIIDSLDLLSS